jgi:sporulation protein YlmC with PRC-barrel domain
MIRASGLYGRAVIDLDTAERVGEVDEIIIDPYGPGIAGYVVACERSMFGKRRRIIIPVEAFHAIGPDALTMRSISTPDYQTAHLDALPRLSELTGRRMVSFGGRLLGSVEDALVSERDGRIIGYPLERPGASSWLDSVFGLGWRSDRPDYVRADAALRIGARLIVVPDDAIASGSDLEESATEEQLAGHPA